MAPKEKKSKAEKAAEKKAAEEAAAAEKAEADRIAAEKAEAERESDMDAELWRAAEEAQAVYETQKIEKKINAAEKEYSDKIEAIKLKKKTIAKVTSHIDLTHDDGSGIFIHL